MNIPTAKHSVDQRQESISVVVAVYNIEDYICECVDSIINQTIQPEEIILVDDGSTDRSSSLCDEYAKKYGWNLIVESNMEAFHAGVGPFTHGSKVRKEFGCTSSMVMTFLRQMLSNRF